ncbi:transposase [Streptomyces sp. NPDC002561]|uniref:transposase n=1 Tax=Streptomyces sp. NPDC002561 TaxID=3154418 RepID=UPI00331E951F
MWSRRQLSDGIRWRTRTGAPWSDVPQRYGPWGRVYDLFRRRQRDGVRKHPQEFGGASLRRWSGLPKAAHRRVPERGHRAIGRQGFRRGRGGGRGL